MGNKLCGRASEEFKKQQRVRNYCKVFWRYQEDFFVSKVYGQKKNGAA